MMEQTANQQEQAAWLRLMLTDGVGNTSARKLLAAFGLPTAIFEQSTAALGQVVSERQALALKQLPEGLDKQIARCDEWLALDARTDHRTRRIVTLGDALYPSALLTLPDPPLVLWLLGRIDLLEAHGWPAGISIVGSRNPTQQGDKNAFAFAHSFADSGLCVISGMALGIDAAAHSGALSAGQSSEESSRESLLTIAVVGTGLDRVYPKQNLELAHRIADHGLVVSEFQLGSPPAAANFPKRNRLIAALGLGTLVVEAALQSGSLITARECLEVGKDVFAIPGSIHIAQSKGCHALIKQGAKLVESAADVLEELRIERGTRAGHTEQGLRGTSAGAHISPTHAQHPLVLAMGFDPVSFDVLQARVDIDAAALQVQLLELELDNVILRVPGGLYQVAL
ncbi:MAG: DNA-processing protein DprA [Cytophagales bacterium]|nr:DNA-processing protein DprA [Cytophagales bacterium]